jgi:hypothetical protein
VSRPRLTPRPPTPVPITEARAAAPLSLPPLNMLASNRPFRKRKLELAARCQFRAASPTGDAPLGAPRRSQGGPAQRQVQADARASLQAELPAQPLARKSARTSTFEWWGGGARRRLLLCCRRTCVLPCLCATLFVRCCGAELMMPHGSLGTGWIGSILCLAIGIPATLASLMYNPFGCLWESGTGSSHLKKIVIAPKPSSLNPQLSTLKGTTKTVPCTVNLKNFWTLNPRSGSSPPTVDAIAT